ncbi:hypothetical protein [Oleispirillum naphthae]|uniref:hypothetical protein n=1 Tax=Oleispirillum naphthae TaxID=2838853 RepID=UPI00308241DA
MPKSGWGCLALLSAALLGGCETMTAAAPPPAETPMPLAQSEAGRHVREGLAALRAGRSAAAVAAFNRALSQAPSQAGLHLLAGFAYHLDYLHGNFAARDLAETGYIVAAQLDPSLTLAQLQLGRLYLDSRRPAMAQAAFLKALDAEPDDAEAVEGLAVASYYARDLQSAVGAVRRLPALRPVRAEDARDAAMIYAAAGLGGEAAAARARFAELGGATAAERLLDRRMAQWRAVHAQVGPQVAANPYIDDDDDAKDAKKGNAESGGGGNGPKPASPNWADCPQWLAGAPDTAIFETDDGDGDSGTANVRPLRPLPSPCVGGRTPRMAVIDATIIRTEEVLYNSHGVNLLDGLSVMFTGNRSFTHGTPSSGSDSSTHSSSLTIALPTAGVSYSLNIANASDLRNDVLARPSLIALDRQPSVFFSGNNITVSVSGSISDGDLEDKLVGVSLAVTPTFLDDDTLLLAVKAARSAIEDSSAGTFTEALNTSLNSVSANVMMRMDQSLVLSGLTEKTNQSLRDRTPVLGDLPGLQYLFSSSQKEQVQRSILVVLTPRRPVTDDAAAVPSDPRVAEMRDRLRGELALPPVTLSAMRMLASNRYVAQYRSGDIAADAWKARNAFDRLIDDAVRILYF